MRVTSPQTISHPGRLYFRPSLFPRVLLLFDELEKSFSNPCILRTYLRVSAFPIKHFDTIHRSKIAFGVHRNNEHCREFTVRYFLTYLIFIVSLPLHDFFYVRTRTGTRKNDGFALLPNFSSIGGIIVSFFFFLSCAVTLTLFGQS